MTALWVLAGSVAYAAGATLLAIFVGRLLDRRNRQNGRS